LGNQDLILENQNTKLENASLGNQIIFIGIPVRRNSIANSIPNITAISASRAICIHSTRYDAHPSRHIASHLFVSGVANT
jgi:hypothetical protein